jgi:hypothetical protein
VLGGKGCGRWFRETRACSRFWNTVSSTIPRSVPAISPGSVYWQRSSAVLPGCQEGTSSVAELTSRPADRLHWLDRVDGHRCVPPPGSPSTLPVETFWLSLESTNRQQCLVRYLPVRRERQHLAASGDEWLELFRRAATTGTESSHGSCQKHDQSHATTLPLSNAARCQSSAPQKGHILFLCLLSTTFTSDGVASTG